MLGLSGPQHFKHETLDRQDEVSTDVFLPFSELNRILKPSNIRVYPYLRQEYDFHLGPGVLKQHQSEVARKCICISWSLS